METINNKKEFEINKNKIAVVKCCASCAYKGYDRTGERICIRGCGNVRKEDVCLDWLMNSTFFDAGGGEPGRIKSRHYIKWLVQQRDDEIARNAKISKNISQLREEYEAEFGSRYMTDFELRRLLPLTK